MSDREHVGAYSASSLGALSQSVHAQDSAQGFRIISLNDASDALLIVATGRSYSGLLLRSPSTQGVCWVPREDAANNGLALSGHECSDLRLIADKTACSNVTVVL